MDGCSHNDFLHICRNIGIKFPFRTYMCTTLILGKNFTQASQSKFYETLFSETGLCRLRLKQWREIQDFIF